jgi:hypothetical protein
LQDKGYIGIEVGVGRKNTNHYLLNMMKLSTELVQELHPSIPEKVQVIAIEEKVQVTTEIPIKGASDDIKGAIAIAPEPLLTVNLNNTSLNGDRAHEIAHPRATPISIPADFTPTRAMVMAAEAKYPDLDVEDATEEWICSMESNRAKYRYTDWNQAWWGAMKRANRWASERGGQKDETTKLGRAIQRRERELLQSRLEPIPGGGVHAENPDHRRQTLYGLPSPPTDTRRRSNSD